MTDAQAALVEDASREAWLEESIRPAAGHIEGRWYAANTCEPIRDETLREGLGSSGRGKRAFAARSTQGSRKGLVSFPGRSRNHLECGRLMRRI